MNALSISEARKLKCLEKVYVKLNKKWYDGTKTIFNGIAFRSSQGIEDNEVWLETRDSITKFTRKASNFKIFKLKSPHLKYEFIEHNKTILANCN